MSIKGSLLVETVITLFLTLLVLGMNLDLVRRAYYEVLLHHGAFLHVRKSALGMGNLESKRQVESFFKKALGARGGGTFMRRVRFEQSLCGKGLQGKLYIRYSAFLRFPYRNHSKHHFEITKKCIFPF